MATEFKTIFQSAREQGFEEGMKEGFEEGREKVITLAIKGLINKTRFGDAFIADTLNVSVELVKTMRQKSKQKKRRLPLKKTLNPQSLEVQSLNLDAYTPSVF